MFDLVRVKLAFPDLETRVGALLYVAHWSALRIDPHTHEFVAERFVDGLRIDMPVIMECDRNAVELPYESHVRASNGDLYLARTFVIL